MWRSAHSYVHVATFIRKSGGRDPDGVLAEPQRMLVIAIAFAAWWMLVALAGMLRWRRVAAAGACLGLAGQVVVLALAISGYAGALMVAYWQAVVALVTAASALGSLRSQGTHA